MTVRVARRAGAGAGLIVAAVFLLSLGDAIIKGLGADLSLWQLYTVRGSIAIPILLTLVAARHDRTVRPNAWGWVLLRSALIGAMWIAYHASLPLVDLSVAAAALYTAPLFIALLSGPLAGEPIRRIQQLGVVVGFAGVIAILRPPGEAFSPASLLPVAAALLYALAGIVTRRKCPAESPWALALNLNLCLLALGGAGSVLAARWSGVPAARDEAFLLRPWSAMDASAWAAVTVLAIVVAVASPAVATAYQIGPPVVVGTSENAYLVFAALWSTVFFGEAPGSVSVLGMVLVAVGGWLVALPTGPDASPTPGPWGSSR